MGLVGFSNTVSKEGAKYNVNCNVVAPTAWSRMTKDIMPPGVCVCVCVCTHVVMGIPPRERGAIAVARFDCCYRMQVRQLCQIWSYLFHASETTLPNMVISLSCK